MSSYLARWNGYHYLQRAQDGDWLVLVHEREPARERWWLHAVLFIAAIITTSVGGAMFGGVVDPWSLATFLHPRAGFAFSLPLLAILLAHESGHYVTARRYRVNASPPYFIPFPAALDLIGTLGAFIRLRSPLFDRRTLFDVGVAGPLAGIVIAIPVLLVGLHTSIAWPGLETRAFAHQFARFNGDPILIGDSLLFMACRALLGIHGMIELSPLAVAGWVGIFVTSLNLLPLAQLDGGHVAFAMHPNGQRFIARAMWVALIPLGLVWHGWWFWAVLSLAIGRGRLVHPPVIAPERPLDATRQIVGWFALVLFLVTFMPLPISG
ncbi:MAG: site-2 protease family protein [Gemmatimonadaceae bacterium]